MASRVYLYVEIRKRVSLRVGRRGGDQGEMEEASLLRKWGPLFTRPPTDPLLLRGQDGAMRELRRRAPMQCHFIIHKKCTLWEST